MPERVGDADQAADEVVGVARLAPERVGLRGDPADEIVLRGFGGAVGEGRGDETVGGVVREARGVAEGVDDALLVAARPSP